MTKKGRSEPERLPVGSVDPTEPGHPWWRYRQMEVPNGHVPADATNGDRELGEATHAEGTVPPIQSADDGRSRIVLLQAHVGSGVAAFFGGAAILAGVAIATQLGASKEGPWLVPLGAFLLAVAAAQRFTRTHLDEAWLPRLLLLGIVVKLLASYARYFNLTANYQGVGDATDYSNYGRDFAHAWLHGGAAPVLKDLRKTNFVRWFTGIVYYVFGSNMMTGTFVFALLAFVGTYLWYRATADGVPIVDKRLYLTFVLFSPSIAFWPAIIGKEALMQLGLGTVAFGACLLYRRKLLAGLVAAFPGGWLVWVVRPHLLALAVIAAAIAYVAGRVGARGWGLASRPAGIIVMAFLAWFTIGQAASFLGLSSLSIKSIQSELDQTTAQTAEGGSQFSHGSNSLNPVNYPMDFATVFLRPFPWEAHGLQLLASAEGAALAALLVLRRRSLRVSLARSREMPFLMFAWILVGLYAVTFASFANFGILVRERSLVLPAILVLISVDPERDRSLRNEDVPEPRHSVLGAA